MCIYIYYIKHLFELSERCKKIDGNEKIIVSSENNTVLIPRELDHYLAKFLFRNQLYSLFMWRVYYFGHNSSLSTQNFILTECNLLRNILKTTVLLSVTLAL